MIIFYHEIQELIPITNEQVMAKPDDMASNTDTGYETGSVASTSSSSQIMKVRHTMVAGVMNEIIMILYQLLH